MTAISNIKGLYDKIELDSAKADEIRTKIASSKRSKRMWLIPATAALAAVAVTIAISFVLGMSNLGKYKPYTIRAANGETITYSIDPATGRESYTGFGREYEYAQVKDGRLFFVIYDEWTDVTDICSSTEYYRYEIEHEDGAKEVIYIGGSVEDKTCGWFEFVYAPDGTCIARFGGTVLENYVSNFKWKNTAIEDEEARTNPFNLFGV